MHIRRVAVIGAGVMGAGVAQVFSEHGFNVRLFSRRASSIRAALQQIQKRQDVLVRDGVLSRHKAAKSRSRIEVTTSLTEAIRGADFVSENIKERTKEKRDLFKQLGNMLPQDVILSTNTSSLPMSSLESAVRFPERFVGFHWMNPAHLMPIVEVISGPRTSEGTVRITRDLALRAGKSPIVLKREIPGYVINRLQYALFREAFALVKSGIVDAAEIDTALKDGLGLRWAILGPFEHMDLSGLDTVSAVSKSLFKRLDRSLSSPLMLTRLVRAGKLGLKTGGGFYGLSQTEFRRLAERRDDALMSLLRCLRDLRRRHGTKSLRRRRS